MTLEMQLEQRIRRNERVLTANRARQIRRQANLDVAALRQAARRDYGPTRIQMAAFEIAACIMMALALWAVG